MEVVPLSVGRAARRWDEQHLDLAAAARQIRRAPTAGFTAAVAGAADRFASVWERHTDALGADCEARADGLRVAIREYVESDRASWLQGMVLRGYLLERR